MVDGLMLEVAHPVAGRLGEPVPRAAGGVVRVPSGGAGALRLSRSSNPFLPPGPRRASMKLGDSGVVRAGPCLTAAGQGS